MRAYAHTHILTCHFSRFGSGDHLWNLLRPELVLSFAQAFQKPLSSDAFTGFGHHNWVHTPSLAYVMLCDHCLIGTCGCTRQQVHNTEVFEANQYLLGYVIPTLANRIATYQVTVANGRQLCDLMHANGMLTTAAHTPG
jgi:hypothetical protein